MNNYEFDFEQDFENDDEVNAALDCLITTVGEQAEIEDNQNAIINPIKIQQVLYTYKVLKYLTKGSKANVTYELHAPYKSMGSVSVVGKNLALRNPEWFMKAVELANNFEVFPKTDGTVQMDFTFHGLTQPLE